jgi:hypothetical protein
MLVNLKTNRIINQVMKGSTIGYVINGDFYSLDKLRQNLEIIPTKQFIPF